MCLKDTVIVPHFMLQVDLCVSAVFTTDVATISSTFHLIISLFTIIFQISVQH